MTLNTIINAGDRKQRMSTIEKKLNDKHAEVVSRIRDVEMADDVSVNPCSNGSSRDCLVARGATVKLLRGVRSLYAHFGLTPPPLGPELQAEVESPQG
jgi:hypothetical protein